MSDVSFQRPVVLIGGLAPMHRDAVRGFVRALNAPVYAEPLSGLREDHGLDDLLITGGERMIGRGAFDGVIRLGNVPALRFWRDLDESTNSVAAGFSRTSDLPVVSYSDAPFAGLSRGTVHPLGDLPSARSRPRDSAFFETDRRFARAFAQILDDEPQSELAMIRDLSQRLTPRARVYLGNSLPIREWDLVATRSHAFEYEANRGANGIDGQLSTFFGWCMPGRENVALLGDLTTLYDLNAPWIVPQLDADIRFTVIVINNGGGRIFSRVPSLRSIDRRLMENEHDTSFEQWAAMWKLRYNEPGPRAVIEIRPDRAATDRVWQRYDRLWS